MSLALEQLLPGHCLPPSLASMGVSGMSLDTRRLRSGEAFVAVPGTSADGRDHIDQAIAGGATLVLRETDSERVEFREDVPLVGVPGLSRMLGELASRLNGQPAHVLQVLAVTGTNGKTSTAWFLRDALQADGVACALVGTLGMMFDGDWQETVHTTPDPFTLHAGLARFVEHGASSVVMEVSSHALDQDRLQAVPVAVAVFTNLSRDHLDYHGDMDTYFASKARLFHDHESALAVINGDDDWGRRLLGILPSEQPRVVFGAGANVSCSAYQPHSAGMQCRFSLAGAGGAAEISMDVPLFGRFNRDNLLAVAGVLQGLGRAPEVIERALAGVTPVPGRMEAVAGTGAGPRVLVDYAHTPDALEQALGAAREHFTGRLWCVFGCGGDRDRGKRSEMAAVAERAADRLVLTSDNPRFEEPMTIINEMSAGLREPERARHIVDRREAVRVAVQAAAEEDMVLIAGKGHERCQEIEGVFHAMDDRQLAAEALKLRKGEVS